LPPYLLFCWDFCSGRMSRHGNYHSWARLFRLHLLTLSRCMTWQIVRGLRLSILRGSLDADCKITIIRLPELYAEDYAADFKEILDVVGWKYDERLSTAAVKKGISIRALDTPPASKVCAETINQVTGNWGRARNGDALALRGTRLQWLAENEAPDYLKDCPSGCVEVDFGNVDAAR
jgi:hypothetical protein